MEKIEKLKRILAIAAVGAALTSGTLYAAGEPASLDGDTVDYDMKTGVITATGNVLMTKGSARVAGAKAVYNSKTEEGNVTGGVIAQKEDMRMTAAECMTDGKDHMIATGDVHGQKADKTFAGERVDYFAPDEYMLMETGGIVTSKDGTITADRLEGWLKEDRYKGTGHAHLVSPPKKLEAGGDQLDYFGQQQGKAILTGNAWAIQDNNTLNSSRLTIYIADDGNAKVE